MSDLPVERLRPAAVTDDLTLLLASSAAAVKADPKEARQRFHETAKRNDPNPPCPHCGKRHRTLTPDECADRSMSEDKLTERVLYRAKKYGWRGAHAGRAWIPGDPPTVITPMAPGWPDWTFAKAGHRLIFCELKREKGEVSDEQWEWLVLLNETGNRAVVIRPSDLRMGRVEAIFKFGAPIAEVD